jgi:hypothetical protein
VDGKYGTGYVPPTFSEWAAMKKLRNVSDGRAVGTYIDQSVDHSATQWFPPIGSQGSEGSCTTWSAAYYVHTYTMARENGWDISDANWVIGSSSDGNPGWPNQDRDHIFSPDFVYHQINSGVDDGSSVAAAYSMLCRMGGATWDLMPYDQDDHDDWPSAAAFLQAARYRGREVHQLNGYLNYGYIIVRTDADVNLIKNLIYNGYCLTAVIEAEELYGNLGPLDVIDDDTLSPMDLDHAQTIVGFKDGTAWNPTAPDS